MAIRQPRARAGPRPPLEAGDHLTRDEFERRYERRPDIRKAELVQGVVYVASPVKVPQHADPSNLMNVWLGAYAATRPGVIASGNGSVRLSDTDVVQPDVMLRLEGGTSTVDSDGFLTGAPELVVEIAASSASYDLYEKKESYRRGGVQEYIVWRTLDAAIDWFSLRDGAYAALDADANGVTYSGVFEGLKLDIPRLLSGDRTAILP